MNVFKNKYRSKLCDNFARIFFTFQTNNANFKNMKCAVTDIIQTSEILQSEPVNENKQKNNTEL